MVFKDIEELKQFIIWAKSQKVRTISTPQVSFELSDLALVEDVPEIQLNKSPLVSNNISTYLEDLNSSGDKKEDEDTLFWSAKP